jgi:hypothetical protein
MKRTNKGVQPDRCGQPPAEFVEKRPSAKGNPGQTTVTGTQGPEAASGGLDRVREAAKRDKGLRFTQIHRRLLDKGGWLPHWGNFLNLIPLTPSFFAILGRAS